MKLLTLKYRATVYHRVPTFGGMDSEPGGSTVEDHELNLVVEDDYPNTLAMARAWCDHYAGNDRDDAYEFGSLTVGVLINGILSPVKGRLS